MKKKKYRKKSVTSGKLTFYSNIEVTGEAWVAFGPDDEFITMVAEHDASWRSEYLDCILNTFGIMPVHTNLITSKQKESLKNSWAKGEVNWEALND